VKNLGRASRSGTGRDRYEKTARSYPGVLCLAAALDWLKR
jgi:hypothetical protein